jgi:hypothetical protein
MEEEDFAEKHSEMSVRLSKIRRFKRRVRVFALPFAVALAIGCTTPGAGKGDKVENDLPDPGEGVAGGPAPITGSSLIGVPDFARVMHPDGYDIGDLRTLFKRREAPDPASLASCDQDYRKLKTYTESADELKEGVREMVRRDPTAYHWCFYSKVLALEEFLRSDAFIDQKQKKVLETYEFITPVARGFMTEFRDSRYFRWASYRYRQISAAVFYRKLEMTPNATEELVDVGNPFLPRSGNEAQSTQSEIENNSKDRILEKYHIEPGVPIITPIAQSAAPTAPAPGATPLPTPTQLALPATEPGSAPIMPESPEVLDAVEVPAPAPLPAPDSVRAPASLAHPPAAQPAVQNDADILDAAAALRMPAPAASSKPAN